MQNNSYQAGAARFNPRECAHNSGRYRLLERLAANPAASINAACHGWSETQAAYRFFDNSRVEPDKILEPHRRATEQRIAAQSVALVVQDTTELDYSSHPARDLGLLNKAKRRRRKK